MIIQINDYMSFNNKHILISHSFITSISMTTTTMNDGDYDDLFQLNVRQLKKLLNV